MEFHLYLPQMRMAMPDIVERARNAEGAGFAGIAMMDHLAPPGAVDTPMFEAMTTAAWVAAKTERLTVGHLVLCDTFRHPVMLAKEAVTLDHASEGRFELGIGWGSVPAEFERYGIGDTTARVRVERLAETLAVLRALWSGESVSYRGEHFALTEAAALPVPTRAIPITIGGTGPRTLKLVAEYADWWNVQVDKIGQLDELRDRVGTARVSVQQMVTVIPPNATAAEREKITATANRRFSNLLAKGGLVTGTPAELTEHFGALAARGVDRVYAWFTDFAKPDTLAAFTEVIEGLR
ncbi:LLM class flavin-dependent oxidoreductase [Frankia sp. AgB1.9]|uniref:LLM class flavin-dependent oxidoreductase n=1 Tax=unclassified Frankia TaxID=2632575 RepID=UPI0019320A27|nr:MULTISPECIES: LLM class flavin-dependent oxidoreductase [unclassified Frankia]MBL7492245.1 LLM class flavin-dependent oxidoreductase [Frankia sp. AgW1.1]MBL7550079.1 LLM class flavin-dependent oxidoreductase [Frankia sp. AgB1.9]MBL7621177.1 LLM class flavin-dependent oxidoreductase [Frankia sp. AgB1.8]